MSQSNQPCESWFKQNYLEHPRSFGLSVDSDGNFWYIDVRPGPDNPLHDSARERGDLRSLGVNPKESVNQSTRQPDCCVYIAQSNSGHVKIGVSKHPKRRVAELETGTPHKISLEYTADVDDALCVEKQLHEQFSQSNVSGEWFEISVNEAKNALDAVIGGEKDV